MNVKKGGGVAVYIKQDIHVNATSLANLNKSNENIELQCLILRPPHQKNFVLISIYGPPNGNFQTFNDAISDCLDEIALQESLETFINVDINNI